MRILINLTLYTAILALTGCGDDPADQAAQQGKAVQQDKAAMQEHVAMQAHAAMKPQWANLENNVYHYPK